MARCQTLVQLNQELLALLDRRSAREGVSRSAVIRHAVAAYLEVDREAEIDRQIIEGYTRMPQTDDDDLDEWSENRRRESWDDLPW